MPGCVVGYCDNNYANGGDIFFVEYLLNSTKDAGIGLHAIAYAGWNTNGNTIGTVVANSIVLAIYGHGHEHDKVMKTSSSLLLNSRKNQKQAEANVMFNTLRILEDVYYQSRHRQDLITYVDQIYSTNGECSTNLTADISFYDRYTYKLLQARFVTDIKNPFVLPDEWNLSSIFFPWNRTFEIGLCLSLAAGQTFDSSCEMGDIQGTKET